MAGVSGGLNLGSVLDNRYRLEDYMGSGGFGITYKAFDMKNNCLCVIKELFPRQLVVRAEDRKTLTPMNMNEQGQFEHSKERFIEEAYSLQELKNVKNVVNVSDYFEQNGTCYFVMEYLDGMTLKQLLKANGGPLTWKMLSPIAEQAGQALAEVHAHKLFHRDISPDNIFLTKKLELKLIDFGNAKVLARTNNEGLSVFLKPGYAPFEQYSSKRPQGTYTDVYSFAATLYYLLTATKIPDPFDRLQNKDYVTLDNYGYSTTLSEGFNRALAVDYKNRTQTMNEFLTDIGLKPWVPGGQTDCESTDVLGGTAQDTTRRGAREIETEGTRRPEKKEWTGKKQALIDVHIGDLYQIYILPPNVNLLIGRNANYCNIVTNKPYISGKHLEIMFDDITNEVYVCDHSSMGTFVNSMNARMIKGKIVQLPVNTILYLGGQESWIEVRLINA